MLWDLIQVSQQAHNRTKNRPFPDWQSIIQGPAPTLSTAKSSASLGRGFSPASVTGEIIQIFPFAEAERGTAASHISVTRVKALNATLIKKPSFC